LEISSAATFANEDVESNFAETKKRLGKTGIVEPAKSLSQSFHVKQTSSRDAARDAAERRWCNKLSTKYNNDPVQHARILDAIDETLHAAATDAELAAPGTGFFLIEAKLRDAPVERGQS
jgi:hypothetical protein